MMVAINILLPLLAQLAPGLGSSAIGKTIAALTQALPALVELGTEVAPLVKNIIGALRSNAEITQQQLDELTALEARIDAAFESAAKAAEAEDVAAAAAARGR